MYYHQCPGSTGSGDLVLFALATPGAAYYNLVAAPIDQYGCNGGDNQRFSLSYVF